MSFTHVPATTCATVCVPQQDKACTSRSPQFFNHLISTKALHSSQHLFPFTAFTTNLPTFALITHTHTSKMKQSMVLLAALAGAATAQNLGACAVRSCSSLCS
jgi:hypothetical protein